MQPLGGGAKPRGPLPMPVSVVVVVDFDDVQESNGICYTFWITRTTGGRRAMTTSRCRQVPGPPARVCAGGSRYERPRLRPAAPVLGGRSMTCTWVVWPSPRAVYARHSSSSTSGHGNSILAAHWATASVARLLGP